MSSEVDQILRNHHGIRIEVAQSAAAIGQAQAFRHQVFCRERGIFAPVAGSAVDQDEFDNRAKHVILRGVDDGQIVATTRVIAGVPGRGGLPMQRFCGLDLFEGMAMHRLGEISRFAISKQARTDRAGSGALLRLGLMRGVHEASEEMALTHWCALMEPSLLRLLRATGVHFDRVGQAVEAFGLRQPCFSRIDRTVNRVKSERPAYYDMMSSHQDARAEHRNARLETNRAS